MTTETADVTPRCGVTEASCICNQWADHEGPHVCECGGSWTFIDGEFRVVSFPDFSRLDSLARD